MAGLVAAYRELGIALTNDRWSWSGKSPSGIIAVTIWEDEFTPGVRPLECNNFNSPTFELWRSRPGNLERLKLLLEARENCNGVVRIVVAKAKDPSADPRTAKSAHVVEWNMRLTELNEKTGEFRLVLAV